MSHREIKAENLPVEGGDQELAGSVDQPDDGVGVDAPLRGQVERVRIG